MVDITLLGATGFTGGLTADYLAVHLPEDASWAIAGRTRAKLEQVAARIAATGREAPEIVIADLADPDSMAKMATDTRVLISTVGPYLQHGEPAVKAAAEAGIDYVDLTGEPQFVDEMWLKYHETAVRTGARLVHACGFDSIPYDLGVLYTVDQLPAGVPLMIRGYIRAKATFSAGTYHSAVGQIAQFRQSQAAAKQRRAREGRPTGRRIHGGGHLGRAEPPVKGFGVPLPTIDPQIVLRSARALERYGPEFTYEHHAHFRTRRMMAMAAPVLAAVAVGAQIPPVRAALLKLKASGDGPSEEQRAGSWFTLTLVGHGSDTKVVTTVRGGDPGYTETAKMLAESAMCLAYDDLPEVVGQTTTAVAMGSALITRLQNAGIDFSTSTVD
ncbi:saccharopine dehydrogenase [Aeromicrobium sp. 636]|uniref:Saccharopine dehydrogenase NADP-binding domain-containing protein n=1 Tax=Aeromicrobium senzhongii TaxID=2663859 RepID=A0A8I0K0K9_9ACTN|nr:MULTISPECIES: saccharopine dehydrogenase NADP-binding domain-containing protein [Aeromicrobium]MBC9225908.1 saccharopine dehydrogenase NADP-binding domain-containing protein [Aeromicrobium senzhongii]MCQ3998015.1 saccharopine dehydrogenase [Aeromicrobium sp. 636]